GWLPWLSPRWTRDDLGPETARGWRVRCKSPDHPTLPGGSWIAPGHTARTWPTIPGNCIHKAVTTAGGPVPTRTTLRFPAAGEPPELTRSGRAGVLRLLVCFDSSLFVLSL